MDSIQLFVIGSEQNEPERINYLKHYFKTENIKVNYFQPWYKNNLTADVLNKYVPVNESLHNRPLRMSEISLFLNYIFLFKKILEENTGGLFLILESDVIFTGKLEKYLISLVNNLKDIEYDCVSIGTGCNLVIPGIDINSNDFYFMRTTKTRCTDSLLFTYDGIKKFYNYLTTFLENGKSLNQPVDNFLDTYFNYDSSFVFLWVHPTICVQGSEHNIYKTAIQVPDS